MNINKNIAYILIIFFQFNCSKNIITPNNYNLNFHGEEIDDLDIITWNVEFFPKNPLTVSYMYDAIISLNSDVFALQEIQIADSLDVLTQRLGENWVSYRSDGSSVYGQLAYLINTDFIELIEEPYTILTIEDESDFAYRLPYILEFKFNNKNFILVNIHLKCCDGGDARRLASSITLNNYIQNNFGGDDVVILGDYNDEIGSSPLNIFYDSYFCDCTQSDNITSCQNESNTQTICNDNEGTWTANYEITDWDIAYGSTNYWSYPSYPSHIDHILITNELVEYNSSTQTILVDLIFENGLADYNHYISDHRPIVITLNIPEIP